MKKCRVCNIDLIVGENWTVGREKSYNNICSMCECKRQKNPKYKEQNKKYQQLHKKEKHIYNQQYWLNNLEKEKQRRRKHSMSEAGKQSRKNKYDELRYKILNHYSNGAMKCMCSGCNEDHEDFLTIDHIHNDGSIHRKEIGIGGSVLYKWLIKNNYPGGFRVLCMNCNFSKGKHGKCSKHQDVI